MKRLVPLLALLFCLRANADDLFPFVLPGDDASPGVANLSGLLDKPAGARGVIAVRDGHFFAGNKRIRFFGVNSVGPGAFPRHEDADKIAGRLAKFGVNVVRFHHLDSDWSPLIAYSKGGSRRLNVDVLDRLDYFVAALKARGIYANINLLVGREFKAADGLAPEIERLGSKEQHVVGFFHAPLLELQMEYTRQLLGHRNPHTGLVVASDPAVAFVEINNENGLIHAWLGGEVDKLPEVFRRDLQKQWNAWLRAHHGSTAALRKAWNAVPDGEQIENDSLPVFPRGNGGARPAAAQRDWMRFLWETEDRYWRAMNRFVKDELKFRGVVMGTIVGCSTPNLMARFDAVDTHAYWQHPDFPGRPWDPGNWVVHNKTMVNERDGGTLSGLALRRVLGKPHCVTEYNHPAPNTYSSEGFLLLAAFGALQDWDAIYAYDYCSRNDEWNERRIPNFFDVDQHPTKMATFAAAAAMFVRGDVSPARAQTVVALDKERELDLLPRSHAWSLISAGEVGVSAQTTLRERVAIATGGAAAAVPGKTATTGAPAEFVWNTGLVIVNSPRSKAVIGFAAGKRIELGNVVIEPGPTMQNGWSAITAIEMQPGRWLITATGYAENTGMGWKNAGKTTVGRDWGRAPSLVEGIAATITLPGTMKAWALDERGQRKAELPVRDGKLEIGPQHQTLWYEVQTR